MTSTLQTRLRARLVTVPKPGTEPRTLAPGEWIEVTIGGEHKAGDDAGLQTLPDFYTGCCSAAMSSLPSRPWRVQPHVYIIEPLSGEAADELDRLTAELKDHMWWERTAVELQRQRNVATAALERIAKMVGWYEGRNIEHPSEVAREALRNALPGETGTRCHFMAFRNPAYRCELSDRHEGPHSFHIPQERGADDQRPALREPQPDDFWTCGQRDYPAYKAAHDEWERLNEEKCSGPL